MQHNPQILDNSQERFQLKAFLHHHLSSSAFSQLSVASGYWDLPGMVELLPAFRKFITENKNSEVRFLIGEELKISRNFLDTKFPEQYIKADISELPFKEEYKEVVSFLTEHLESGRIKVKLYRKTFLHAKCYILGNESEKSIGIIGSSNFTRNGLLGNTELNDIEYDHRIVNYIPTSEGHDPSHRSWFEKLWNDIDSVDWNRKFKTEVLGLSQFGNLSYSPYEIYIRILYEIYKDDIEVEEELKTSEPNIKRNELTVFQRESVIKAKRRLSDKNIGMCLIGDSVGLGKSYIARDIIEDVGYFDRKNVVIVCPASLREDWQKHLKDITVNAPVFSITEFGLEDSYLKVRQALQYNKNHSGSDNAIDLLVIDESHNLKTQGSQSFQNLMEIISDQNFCKQLPKVLLLSATPVNNSVKDLANQILLAKGGDDKFFTPFGIESIEGLFGNTQRQFKRYENEEVFASLYPILNKIMVKRTKHQVKKDFPDAVLNGKKIIFPDEKLINEDYSLDNKEGRKAVSSILKKLEKADLPLYDLFTKELTEKQEEELGEQFLITEFFSQVTSQKQKKSNQTEFESVFHFMDRAIRNLKLIPYSYLSEKLQKTKEEQDETKSRKNLTGIMKITLFKAFDSSLYTFKKSIERYENQLRSFEHLFFEKNKIVSTSIIGKAYSMSQDPENIGIDLFDLIEREIKAFQNREVRKKERKPEYVIQDPEEQIDINDFLSDRIEAFIKQDIKIISLIKHVLDSIKEDTKLLNLMTLLRSLKGEKVLVFSYFAQTVDYLQQSLNAEFLSEIGLTSNQVGFLSSQSGDKASFVRRFSPIAQKQELIDGKINGKPELQLLVSTDVLSEGQNLQDCGTIINYDLHWNPVKMIQRNGRINRLGSQFKFVKIHNFLPEGKLDFFLKLRKRLDDKIKIIGGSVGIDTSILGEQITDKQFGLIEDIYSGNAERQQLALEALERENDLAFDEIFENDLREWLRKASDEERENLLSMNLNKWCALPSFENGDKMLVFNIGKGEFNFIRSDGTKVERVSNQLNALRLIRSFNKERQLEVITNEERENLISLAKKRFNSEKAYQATIEGFDLSEFTGVKNKPGTNSLASAKQDLLDLLHNNADSFSNDVIKRIQNLLTSKHLSVDNRLRAFLKNNNNKANFEFLEHLAITSLNLIKDETYQPLPDPEFWYGYYPTTK